jgi:YD repeat-containing protein
VQPPPNAAALGKYADFPVSYFTGVPDISIPIYELKDGEADLPISLSYHASGIRVGEVASWVGLGWALNAGGVILRTVRGAADEGSYSEQGAYGNPAPRGYYLDSGLKKFPKLPYTDDATGLPESYNSGTGLPLTHYAALGLGTGVVDGEPDIFTFNFNGHTGKFLFDENRTPHLLKDDNLKIAVNFNGTDFVSWTITDENGVEYLFGQNQNGNNYEKVLQQYPTPANYGKGPITSWYLNQIIYPNNKDTINFTYTNETYYYADLSPESESLSFESVSATSPSPYSPSDMLNNTLNVATSRSNPPLPTVSSNNGVRLTGISSKNISIIFEADNPRKDLANWGMELDKIKIYSRVTGQCLKQFRLGYGYFNSPFPRAFDPNSYSYSQFCVDSLRLKLLSMDEFSGDSSIVKPPYVFSYQDSFYLPRRLSFDQDHWGFSNNSSTPYNRYLTPGGIWLSTLGSTTAAGANREPSWPQMSAGTLIGIKDPLGAVTTFQYEANQAAGYLPTGNSMIGGLRIKQITVWDSLTNSTSIRKFQYGPGVLYKVPSYVVTYMNEFYLTENTVGTTGFLSSYGGLGRVPGMLKQSQSVIPLQDLDGAHIGYNTVTELFGVNGENGKKIYTYDQGFIHAEQNSSKINPNVFKGTDWFSNPYPQFGLTGTSSSLLLGNGLFNEITPATLNENLEPGYNNNSFYPSAPEQIDLTRGNLLQVQTFDASGNLLQNISNNFDTSFHGGYWIRGVKGFENLAQVFANVIDDALTYYILHTGISHLTYTATTNYEGGNPVTDTIKYSYESPYHTLPTKITNLRSNGDSIIQKTYYSFDYSPTATPDGVFGVMQQMNLLSPVAKEVWENNTMTGSQVTAYSDFNTNATLGHVIKPSKIYMLATSTPLTTSQAGETAAYSGLRYALLPNSYYTERVDMRFDSVGNAAQENKVKDKITSYQWGYGGIYPVAKVDNAVNTYSTGDSSLAQYKSFQFIESSSQKPTQNYSFSIFPSGTISLSVGYGGNPGTNPTYNVGYVISGSGGNITGTFCKGTGCPAQYTATFVNYPNLPAGNYSISITPYSNVNTSNLPLNMSCSYSSLGPVSSGIKEFFYDGFEENNNSNVINGSAHTGKRYWNGSTYTTSYALPDSKAYTIQWWRLSGGVWVFNQQAYAGPTTLTGPLDDIRIFPSDALMSTYTYDPGIGMTSQTDPSGHSTNYFYDSLRRLSYIKDQDGNILKKICYNYNGQTTSCILKIFTNAPLSRTYTRNNCGAGYTGSNVTYTVPAGKYSATTQAAADQLAATDTATNGQNYANTNGTCTSTNFDITTPNSAGLNGFQAVFTNTNTLVQTTFSIPAEGGIIGSLPGGTYNITISKPGNSLAYIYTVCGNTISQVSATFNNIVIGSACNSLDVDTF